MEPPIPEPSALPIRHVLATISYRLGKSVRDAPPEFRVFHAATGLRTPGQILAHIGDLMDWALSIVGGHQQWHNSEPLPWLEEVERFYRAIEALDERIAQYGLGGVDAERLFQGALADALTHTGQIAMLRRMAGIPIRGENYYVAEIVEGRLGPEQADPHREFD
jgi:hypothetical protein